MPNPSRPAPKGGDKARIGDILRQIIADGRVKILGGTMKRTTGLVILALAFGGGAAAQNAAPPQMPIFPQQTPEEKALSDAHQAAYAKMPDTQGTGAYPAMKEEDPGLPDHVVYRPIDLAKVGKGQLGWSHEFADNTASVSANFSSLGGSGFQVSSAPIGRDAALVGVDADFQVSGWPVAIFAGYGGAFSGSSNTQAFTAGLRFNW